MSIIRLISSALLIGGLVFSITEVSAHGNGSGDFSDELIVTRHFTGIWDQVDHEAQGIALEVVEQADDSRRAVAYWYTYGADKKSAWFMGIGDLIDNRIEFELFDSEGVGFMQAAQPGNDSVVSIGTMTIVFDSCTRGVATFETSHGEVGNGSFNIVRLTQVMNTHCSGGISDDMHADAMFGEQRLGLTPAREGVGGSGHARFEIYPGQMNFEIEVEGLPDGVYHLHVGAQVRGEISIQGGRGTLRFTSPGETGRRMMTFDPRGMLIEILDDQGVVLSSFDQRFEQDNHDHDGDGDHNYHCESGHGPGHGMGMADCVEDGEYIEIEVDLVNTGVIGGASGEAEWAMNPDRIEFSIEIEDIPVGSYPIAVGGEEVGVIEAIEMHDGEVYGHLKFRDPDTHGREPLDFEPRGQKIEVLLDGEVILEADFPLE